MTVQQLSVFKCEVVGEWYYDEWIANRISPFTYIHVRDAKQLNVVTSCTIKKCKLSSNLNAASSNCLVVSIFSFGHCHFNANSVRVVSELLLSQALLFKDKLVRLPHRLDLEETVHALKRDALGFWQEEEDEDDGADHHGREEEVDAAA
jgi:hypothetical protein